MTSSILRVLNSAAPLVAIEAAAGCGKTWTAATFATECAGQMDHGRVLLLSHTHAACGEFQRRCSGADRGIDIDTCDGFALKIVGPYAAAMALPQPLDEHLGRGRSVPFSLLSRTAVELFRRAPSVAATISRCYPVIIVDEHQDSSETQHEMVMSLCRHGSRVRAFGDPMQAIQPDGGTGYLRWPDFFAAANENVVLDTPHRWKDSPLLGAWIADARALLKVGRPLTLDGRPPEVSVRVCPDFAGRHRVADRDAAVEILKAPSARPAATVAVLAFLGPMVKSLAAASGWRSRVNEGASLEALDDLLDVARTHAGDPGRLAAAFLDFAGEVGSGLPDSTKVAMKQRLGATLNGHRAGHLQLDWFRCLQLVYDSPDHRGLAKAMLAIRRKPPRGFSVRLKDHAWALSSLETVQEPSSHLRGLLRARRRRPGHPFVSSTDSQGQGPRL